MSKLFSITTDGSLNISVEERLFHNIRKAHTWYTNKAVCTICLFAFAVIDILGFKQIMNLTMEENPWNRFIITSALAVAYEIAPLYIGYSICLKCYGFGKRIHNWVLLFSCCSCILGIIGNIYFRFSTLNNAYLNRITGIVDENGLPLTVLMCILPIITSLVNLVMGCLTFDPLQFDLARLSKKLAKLKLRKQQMNAFLEEFNDEQILQLTLEQEETNCYEKAKNDIYASQTALKTYTIVKISNMFLANKEK